MISNKINYSEPSFDLVVSAIIQIESSGGLYTLRHEPTYKWLYKVDEMAAELQIFPEAERAQQRFSYGPMQIMGATARELGFRGKDLKELEGILGLEYGIKYLLRLKRRFPKYPDYVAAFNAGSVRVDAKGLYVNQKYVDKFLAVVYNF